MSSAVTAAIAAPAPSEAQSPAPVVSPSPQATSAQSPSPVASPSPQASPRLLTRADALKLALERNNTLKVSIRQEKEAYWAWKVAGKTPNLTVNLDYIGGSSTNNYVSQTQNTDVTVQQNFGPIGNTAWNGRAAEKAYEMAHASVLQTRLTLVQNVKDAFIGLLIAQDQKQVAVENLKLANDLYDITNKKFKAGAGPRMDVLNAEIQRATAVQALIGAEATLKQARAALIPLLELSANEPVQATGSSELPEIRLVLDQLLTTAKASHPQMVLAQKTLEQAIAQVHAVRSQANPSPSIGYVYAVNPTIPNTAHFYAFLGTLSIPIDWGQILYGVRQQKETVREKEDALRGVRSTVVGNVKSAFANYEGAWDNASTYRATVLEPSEKLLDMTKLGYTKGALPFITLLNAEQTLRLARSQYFSLLQAAHQGLDALEAAVGHALDEGSTQ